MRLGTPIDYLSSRGQRSNRSSGSNDLLPSQSSQKQPLQQQSSARKGKLRCLLIIAFGLLTFFFPLITVDPPVVGITHWSEFDMVVQMYKGNLHQPVCERCGEPLIRSLIAVPFMITLIYLLMLAALAPLSVPYASKTVALIAALGVYQGLNLRRAGTMVAMKETFDRSGFPATQIHYGALQLVLILVMVALCLVSLGVESD